MPQLYQCEIFTLVFGKRRSNVWHIWADTLDDAKIPIPALFNLHQRLLLDKFIVVEALLSTMIVGDRQFTHVEHNEPGLRLAEGRRAMPPFNTLLVSLGTPNSDTGRKFFRGALATDDVDEDGTLHPVIWTEFANQLGFWRGANSNALPYLRVGEVPRPISTWVVEDRIQERQERRRRRKKPPAGP